jgi:hypothetical protein
MTHWLYPLGEGLSKCDRAREAANDSVTFSTFRPAGLRYDFPLVTGHYQNTPQLTLSFNDDLVFSPDPYYPLVAA